MTNELYKGKYLICIYNIIENQGDIDELEEMFESVQEFADYLNTTKRKATDILYNHLNNKSSNIIVNGMKRELSLVDVTLD